MADALEDQEGYSILDDDLLKGFSDVEQSDLTVANLSIAVGSPISGSLARNSNDDGYIFKPNTDANGTVRLSYFVSDADGAKTLASTSFQVLPVDDAPIRTSGTVNNLFLLEDYVNKSTRDKSISLRFNNLNYSTGGGGDEQDKI